MHALHKHITHLGFSFHTYKQMTTWCYKIGSQGNIKLGISVSVYQVSLRLCCVGLHWTNKRKNTTDNLVSLFLQNYPIWTCRSYHISLHYLITIFAFSCHVYVKKNVFLYFLFKLRCDLEILWTSASIFRGEEENGENAAVSPRHYGFP